MQKVFDKEGWLETLQGLQSRYKVFVPVREGDFWAFRELSAGKRPAFDYPNSRLSPKALMYPQSERLLECPVVRGEEGARVLREVKKTFAPQAIVGLRPCDGRAFELVGLNFEAAGCRDPWWVRRREASTLVGLGCRKPCPGCFCTSTGGGPYDRQGLDVLLTDLGEGYLAESLTEKGLEWLECAGGGREPEEEQAAAARRLAAEAEAGLDPAVVFDRIGSRGVLELFDAPFWEEVSFACLSCGVCTYLCPTCWCFDIQDEAAGGRAERIRNWDSCMFALFTLHGSGHNPRQEKLRRVRQRFMHKLRYYPERYGRGVQCTGCGRCVRHCPVNIDIREVAKQMANSEGEMRNAK